MDPMYGQDKMLILKSLRAGKQVPLPVDRQIEVISEMLDRLQDPGATGLVQEGYNMLKNYLETLKRQDNPTNSPARPESKMIMVDPREIKDLDLNTGIFSDLETEELEELAENIKSVGIIHPIVVTPKMELIAGKMRRNAAILAGLDKIPAIIREIDTNDQLKCCISENLFRRELTSREAYRARQALRAIETPKSAYRLIPELEKVKDPQLQDLLGQLPPQTQEKLYKTLGDNIVQLRKVVTDRDAVTAIRLKQQLAASEKEKEKLADGIKKLLEELQLKEQEKDELSLQVSKADRETSTQIANLSWQINNLRATVKRLEEEREQANTKAAELENQIKTLSLRQVGKLEKIITKPPEDYEMLKRQVREATARSRAIERFLAGKLVLSKALAELQDLLERDGVSVCFDSIKSDMEELSKRLKEAVAQLDEKLNSKDTPQRAVS